MLYPKAQEQAFEATALLRAFWARRRYVPGMTQPDLEERDRAAAEDRLAASEKWARHYVVIRGLFVQHPDQQRDDRGSTLAMLVHERQHRALLLYLMLLSVWPWLHDDKVPLEAHAWMYMLHSRANTRDERSLIWSESTLSRTWKYLESKELVVKGRGRKGRLRVAPRLEDASSDYTFPDGTKNWEQVYFTLPDRFWLNEDFARLDLPALAVLLIVAKETNKKSEVRMTQEQMAEWYGISRPTVAKGLKQLRELGILNERIEWIPAKLSKIRTTQAVHYSLLGDYSTAERAKARQNAERRRRRASSASQGGPAFTANEVEGEVPDGEQ